MALSGGYYKWKQIARDPDLERVRSTSQFPELIEQHKAKQRELEKKKPLFARMLRGKNKDTIEQ